mgnify:CR=1 FL=1
MRRALALAVLGALFVAVPAFAQEGPSVKYSWSLKLEAKSSVDTTPKLQQDRDEDFTVKVTPTLGLKVTASEGSAWSLTASVISANKVVNAGKVEVSTPLVKVSAVKDDGNNTYLLSKVADPLGLVAFNVTDNDGMLGKGAVRVESSAFGPSLTLQLDDVTDLGFAASLGVGPATVGTVATADLPITEAGKLTSKFSGYATAGVGPATVSGAFAMDRSKDKDNTAFGVSAKVKPTDILTVEGKYVTKAKQVGDSTTMSAKATATLAPLEVIGEFSQTTTVSTGAKAADKIAVSATYKAAPLELSGSYTTERPSGTTLTNPKTALSASAKFALVPDVATASGSILSERDQDKDLATLDFLAQGPTAAGHQKLSASLEFKPVSGLTLTPSLTSESWSDLSTGSGSVSSLELKLTSSYQLTSAATLSGTLSRTTYSFPAHADARERALKFTASVALSVTF